VRKSPEGVGGRKATLWAGPGSPCPSGPECVGAVPGTFPISRRRRRVWANWKVIGSERTIGTPLVGQDGDCVSGGCGKVRRSLGRATEPWALNFIIPEARRSARAGGPRTHLCVNTPRNAAASLRTLGGFLVRADTCEVRADTCATCRSLRSARRDVPKHVRTRAPRTKDYETHADTCATSQFRKCVRPRADTCATCEFTRHVRVRADKCQQTCTHLPPHAEVYETPASTFRHVPPPPGLALGLLTILLFRSEHGLGAEMPRGRVRIY
jgi:hypothetical protein